jgi:hypothetical protein
MKRTALFFLAIMVMCSFSSCLYKKGIAFRGEPVSSGDTVGIIIDADNNIKNVVVAKFLQKDIL